ncbi:MAG: hypothetical protein K8R85_10355, partial [Bacteroidetes bacterium]|nr:hypothetical protein [Bacteroidota bacterium]
VIDKLTGKISTRYKVHEFIVSLKDTMFNIARSKSNKRIASIMNIGNTLDYNSFQLEILSKAITGKYYIVFESIICIPIKGGNKKTSNKYDFRLPDMKILFEAN